MVDAVPVPLGEAVTDRVTRRGGTADAQADGADLDRQPTTHPRPVDTADRQVLAGRTRTDRVALRHQFVEPLGAVEAEGLPWPTVMAAVALSIALDATGSDDRLGDRQLGDATARHLDRGNRPDHRLERIDRAPDRGEFVEAVHDRMRRHDRVVDAVVRERRQRRLVGGSGDDVADQIVGVSVCSLEVVVAPTTAVEATHVTGQPAGGDAHRPDGRRSG